MIVEVMALVALVGAAFTGGWIIGIKTERAAVARFDSTPTEL